VPGSTLYKPLKNCPKPSSISNQRRELRKRAAPKRTNVCWTRRRPGGRRFRREAEMIDADAVEGELDKLNKNRPPSWKRPCPTVDRTIAASKPSSRRMRDSRRSAAGNCRRTRQHLLAQLQTDVQSTTLSYGWPRRYCRRASNAIAGRTKTRSVERCRPIVCRPDRGARLRGCAHRRG